MNPGDDPDTLPFVIQQGSWYRGARNAAAVPAVAVPVLFAGGWVPGLEALHALCFLAAAAGIPLGLASLLCLLRYVSMARRDPEGGPPAVARRMAVVLGLVLLDAILVILVFATWSPGSTVG